MIPKVIHYCWFGGNPLPKSAQKCIASWRKYLPDYEIKEWNESNFDVNIIPYTAEAYKAKKYAFVSDYARFWILYKYGGLYFDTDVEVIKNMDDIIAKGAFMGLEKKQAGATPTQLGVAPGLGLGVNPGLGLYKELLDVYDDKHLFSAFGKIGETIVGITSKIMQKKGIKRQSDGFLHCGEITIYPEEYFCPKNYYTGELTITPNTCAIHHYTATWHKNTTNIWAKFMNRLHLMYIRYSVFFFQH